MICIVFIRVCLIIVSFDKKGGSLNTWGDDIARQTFSDSWACILLLLPLLLDAAAHIVVIAIWSISLGQWVICKDRLLLILLLLLMMVLVNLPRIVWANLIHTFWTVLNQRSSSMIDYLALLMLLLLYQQVWCRRPWQLSSRVRFRDFLLHHIASITTILVKMVSSKEAVLLLRSYSGI